MKVMVKIEIPKVGSKTFKRGTKIQNLFNGKMLTLDRDITINFPIDKKQVRKFAYVHSPEFESAYNPSGIERKSIGNLFIGLSSTSDVKKYDRNFEYYYN
jgi:hypothetical protein